MKRKIKAVGQILLAVAVISFGAILGVGAYNITVAEFSGDRWVSVPTTITYTYSVRAWASRTRGSGIEYALYPKYNFVATDGKTYYGDRYAIYSKEKIDFGSEDRIKNSLVVNGLIYYDPENPQQSAIEQPFLEPVMILIPAGLATLLVFSGLYLIVDARRFFKK